MSTPYFSVCIPTYNRGKMLGRAIDSALAQTFADLELIICDNASTDGTETVVRGYSDSRIRYHRFDKLVGMYANHNRCIRLARAPWIVFLHSDDEMAPDALSNFLAAISAADGGVGLVAPRSERQVVRDMAGRPWMSTTLAFPYTMAMTLSGVGSPSVVCFSAAALEQIGGFAEDGEISYTGDHDAYARLAASHWRFAFVDAPVEVFVDGPHRATRSYHASGKTLVALSAFVSRMSQRPGWYETIHLLEDDLPQWPSQRAAQVLYLLALAGLRRDYGRLRRACAARADILGEIGSRRARLPYYFGPRTYMFATRWLRALTS